MLQASVIAFEEQRLKGTVVVFARHKGALLPGGKALNEACGGAVDRAMKNSRFVGEPGQALWVTGLAGAVEQVLVVGLGEATNLRENEWRLRGVDVPAIVADCSKLQRLTGWVPEISFDQSVGDVLDYWRAQVRSGRSDPTPREFQLPAHADRASRGG